MDNSVNPTRNDEEIGYDPSAVEGKWQQIWKDKETNTTDVASAPDPFYALMMFPYPSAEGLHVGNLFAFVGNDIYGRFQRLQGHNVFEPLGYDAVRDPLGELCAQGRQAPHRPDSAEHSELSAPA